jgi:EamA domain-containing membrane protein RarD
MTVLAVLATLGIAGLLNDATSGGYANAFLMAGLAATFAVVWLRNHKPWAKIVAVILAAVAVASVFFVSYYEIFWPVAIILAGIYLFYTALRKPRTV